MQNMSKDQERARYEAPTVTDFGSVEELTRGQIQINVEDFPVGNTPIHASLPVVGPVTAPELPPL
jgi:hypothetical protein